MVVEIQGFIIGRNGYFWKEESNSIKHDILIFKITTISLSMNLSKLIDSPSLDENTLSFYDQQKELGYMIVMNITLCTMQKPVSQIYRTNVPDS